MREVPQISDDSIFVGEGSVRDGDMLSLIMNNILPLFDRLVIH